MSGESRSPPDDSLAGDGNAQTGVGKGRDTTHSDLNLGADLRVMRIRFRKAQGTDANLPARRWAKAAVRVAEETRWRRIVVGSIIRNFGSSDAFADFFVRAGWEFDDEPGWAKSVMELKPFAKESLPDWKPVVRKIIRDQVPDFHNLPEWQTQRNTAEASGKTTKGEVRNAILDDIMSALARLAPESPC